MLTLAVGRITRAGYVYIGMDHFAQPDDELAVAQRQGRLQRSLEGYSTRPEVGSARASASPRSAALARRITRTSGTSTRTTAALDDGRPPIWRGIDLTQDDLLRRAVIEALSCHFRVSNESLESGLSHRFPTLLRRGARGALKPLVDDGLVELAPDWIVVTSRGRLLVRAVCMVFDRYLRTRRARASHSRVI